jgi:hypothetical protein
MGGNFDVVGGKGIENEELQGRAGSANILCGTKSRQLKSSDLNLCHVQAHGISANITSEPETCIELGAGREKGRERAERDAGTEDGGWRMEDGSVVEEATEREVEAQEKLCSSNANVGGRAHFVLAGGKTWLPSRATRKGSNSIIRTRLTERRSGEHEGEPRDAHPRLTLCSPRSRGVECKSGQVRVRAEVSWERILLFLSRQEM